MVSRTSMVGGYAFLIALVVIPIIAAAAAANENRPSSNKASLEAIKDVCHDTSNKKTCVSSITNARKDTKCAIKLLNSSAQDPKTAEAYGYCKESLNDSVYDLEMALDRMNMFDGKNVKWFVADLANRLTGVLTNYDTCLQNYGPGNTHDQLSDLLKEPRELATRILASVTEFSNFFSEHKS